MGPFDFLNNIKQGLEQWFQPSQNQVSSTLSQYMPSRTMNYRLDKSPKAPDITPVIRAATPTPTPQPQRATPTAQDFQQGFAGFGENVPVATQSASFAQAAQQLPSNIDPYLPAIIALMETGGGARSAALNNPFNLSGYQDGGQQFVHYPDYGVSLLGGNNGGVQSQGFLGTVLNNPAYNGFRQSGNLADFFQVYTPPGQQYGNPTLEELLHRYATLRTLFPGS